MQVKAVGPAERRRFLGGVRQMFEVPAVGNRPARRIAATARRAEDLSSVDNKITALLQLKAMMESNPDTMTALSLIDRIEQIESELGEKRVKVRGLFYI